MNKTTILCILDGYGISTKKEGNAIYAAKTPNLDRLFAQFPNTQIEASGKHVGLPHGQMGNSEVGHLTIGAGRIIQQGLALINNSNIAQNKVLRNLIEEKKNNFQGAVHVIGLISEGGVHSHFNHMHHILQALQKSGLKTFVHAITDGRDSAPREAKRYLQQLEQMGANSSAPLKIASISGRFYAMDRDNRWERVEKAYQAIAQGGGFGNFTSYQEVLNEHYKSELSDEFVPPVSHIDYNGIMDGDVVIFTNFRADRMRQLASAIVENEFTKFKRHNYSEVEAIGIMSYSSSLDKRMQIMFPKENVKDTLGEYVSYKKLRQLRIAETEKYAHVTFFFNGGREETFEGEDRILVPSPKVATYDTAPEMSVFEITKKLLEAIELEKYNFICINYANIDMVGHTGDFNATVKALESVDLALGQVLKVVEARKLNLLITADHGNAEEMVLEASTPKTSHTTNKVPLIYVGANASLNINKAKGLSDVAGLVKELLS